MKILFATSECVPFIKTGGLADVVGALPKELIKTGADVRVILPLYKTMDNKWRLEMEPMLHFYVNLGWRRQYVGIYKLDYAGITCEATGDKPESVNISVSGSTVTVELAEE